MGTRNIAEASMNAVETQLRSTASIANSVPIAGRAMFTAEPMKGVINAASVAMTRAARWGGVYFIVVSPE